MKLLITEFLVFLVILYLSFVYGILYLLLEAYPPISFPKKIISLSGRSDRPSLNYRSLHLPCGCVCRISYFAIRVFHNLGVDWTGSALVFIDITLIPVPSFSIFW
ncbi:uncharacterized protein SOCG_02320 [Schizosaccharomyces octosporus yFS286]|uniref:Uncharacterized protein n=1 Tax=Schizosaccharomyces octosporus (strain yFS286) TaxID=483514 RepID=S9Q5C2_SCHOY|nr:uncharacterized protein SOCG_02320 [Schizosaccharomyces octosporus yFS286]EPX74838.1 hypothetical protein SOCG_02320 [Schizosaccharomyces octosporus yFS286]